MTAPPSQTDLELGGVALIAVDRDDDVAEHRAQQLLALAVGGGRRVDTLRQVARDLPAPRALLLGERLGPAALEHGTFGSADVGRALLPSRSSVRADEPVLGLARVELAPGSLGVDLRALEFELGRCTRT